MRSGKTGVEKRLPNACGSLLPSVSVMSTSASLITSLPSLRRRANFTFVEAQRSRFAPNTLWTLMTHLPITQPHGYARSLWGDGFEHRLRPNKRLKLAGGDRFKGIGALCPDGHELTFNIMAPYGRVARSLSAIR